MVKDGINDCSSSNAIASTDSPWTSLPPTILFLYFNLKFFKRKIKRQTGSTTYNTRFLFLEDYSLRNGGSLDFKHEFLQWGNLLNT
jgi:hypothetical protein